MGFSKAFLVGTASGLALVAGGAALAQEDDETDQIIVTGIRGSLQQSIQTKRDANAIVDAISAEDIGKFPDKNIAESLQRVPGIVTNREFGEGERVSLRGLAPNQTRTLINGHAVASADWFVLDQLNSTRNFNYLVMPSDIVSQLQVFKSPTADLEEGGIGGTVNVITRKPLDLKPFAAALSAEGAYTELADKVNPNVSGIVSWKNPSETFGVLVSGVWQEREIRRDGFETFGYSADLNPNGDEEVPTLFGSAFFTQKRERKGVNVEVQFRPTDRLEFGLSGLYTRFDADNVNANYLGFPQNSGLPNNATLTNTSVQNGIVVSGEITRTPGAAVTGVELDVFDRQAFADTRFLTGYVTFEPTDDLTLSGKVGYTDAEGATTRQIGLFLSAPADFFYDISSGVPEVTFRDIDPADLSDLGLGTNNQSIGNKDDELFIYLDAEKRLDLGPLSAIKVGFKYTDHDRKSDRQVAPSANYANPLNTDACGGAPCTAASFGSVLTPDDFLDRIAAPGSLTSYALPDLRQVRSIVDGLPSGNDFIPFRASIYDINEKTYGGYVRADLEGDRWRSNVGVRVVATDVTSSGFVQSSAGDLVNEFGSFAADSESRTYTDFLPSANFAFDVTDDLVLRVAAGRTITRPDFQDIRIGVSLNETLLTASGGSPNVDPFRANQYDVSLEYYPWRDALFAIALYQKDILNFVENELVQETFTIQTTTPNVDRCVPTAGASAPDTFDCVFDVDRRSNGGGGEVRGLELIASTPIANGFGINANYAYVDAETNDGDPLAGSSKHSYQISGYYENDFLSAQLSYNWRDEFFITFDRAAPLNQKAFGSLDASLDINVTEWASLSFDAVNLTNDKIEQFSGTENRPRSIFDNGRYFFFGVRLKN